MRKPKLRELGEAIKALIKGPYTTDFLAAPSPETEGLRAKPKYSEEDCIGCCACAEVCPANAIEVIDDVDAMPPMRKLVLRYGHCIFCGQCERYCTTEKGVKLSNDYDTATFDIEEAHDNVEKELVVCELCREIIGAKDHIVWTARKIGAKRYANPTLIQVEEESLGLTGKDSPLGNVRSAKRPDAMRVLCPRCRREVIVREAWG